MRDYFLIPKKLFTIDSACVERERLRNIGKKVVLTNGCFDLLHVGHVSSLENARKFGDSLWIALNSDKSIKKLKGASRPIFSEKERAYMLSALEVVDGIFIFSENRLVDEILQFRPDIYVKSGDYTLDNLDPSEHKALISVGAEIKFVSFVSGFSTTSTIRKIRCN